MDFSALLHSLFSFTLFSVARLVPLAAKPAHIKQLKIILVDVIQLSFKCIAGLVIKEPLQTCFKKKKISALNNSLCLVKYSYKSIARPSSSIKNPESINMQIFLVSFKEKSIVSVRDLEVSSFHIAAGM